MADEKDKLSITNNGEFVRWKKLMDMEARVEQPGMNGVPAITASEAGVIPGISLPHILKPYIGKQVKITIEVQKEV